MQKRSLLRSSHIESVHQIRRDGDEHFDATGNLPERWLGWSLALALRVISRTWRVNVEGMEILDQLAESQQKHILAFWHRHYITMFPLFRSRSIMAVTNQSHRGQIIAEICRHNRICVMQIPGNGKRKTFENLQKSESDALGLAITVDGPLGPPLKVKQSVVHLASKLDWPVVPVAVESGWHHQFKNRWDRLELPYPLSRIAFNIGTPVHIGQTNSRSELSDAADRLKDAIKCGTALAKACLRTE